MADYFICIRNAVHITCCTISVSFWLLIFCSKNRNRNTLSNGTKAINHAKMLQFMLRWKSQNVLYECNVTKFNERTCNYSLQSFSQYFCAINFQNCQNVSLAPSFYHSFIISDGLKLQKIFHVHPSCQTFSIFHKNYFLLFAQ